MKKKKKFGAVVSNCKKYVLFLPNRLLPKLNQRNYTLWFPITGMEQTTDNTTRRTNSVTRKKKTLVGGFITRGVTATTVQ